MFALRKTVTSRGIDALTPLLFGLVLLLFGQPLLGQTFGKNKVQYKGFDWKVLESAHFRIYFYEGEEVLAEFAGQVVEEAYSMLEADLNHSVSQKIPVMIYNSHNDFEQTNVTLELIEESVGGFTEIYKNRVVVPYEGSYEGFRHVLVHELVHAFQFDLLYGGGVGSMLSKQHLYSIPGWLIEGMAEFFSLGWDSEADMILRDLVISGNLKSLKELSYLYGSYLIYKEGQSVVKFMADQYGRKKIGEILHQVKYRRGLEGAIRESLGIDLEELNSNWMKSLRRHYWPLYAEKEEAHEFGRRITNRRREGGYLNVNPSLSPGGDRVAFLSDRAGYVDIYLSSAIDGRMIRRLVRGERSSGFESLHLLRGGMAWSPNGESIAFSAKAGPKDRLYILDVGKSEVVRSYSFDLDGVFSPSWSPSGDSIVFVGLKDGYSDLYLLPLGSPRPVRLTDDIHDDRDPSWSPDGGLIAFASDRPSSGDSTWRYGSYAVFTLDPDGGELTEITPRAPKTSSPTWSPDGSKIGFASDLGGASNLYIVELADRSLVQVTDLLGGAFAPCWARESERLTFSVYEKGGWEVYVLDRPLQKETSEPQISQETVCSSDSFSQASSSLEADDYSVTFTPDWVAGGFSYSTEYGFAGTTELAFSDILGNHRVYFSSDLFSNITESNFVLQYWYLARRTNFGGAIFQEKNFYWTPSGRILMEKLYGGAALASYPLDKFRRVDLDLSSYAIQAVELAWTPEGWVGLQGPRATVFIPTVSLIKDTALWGSTGPIAGNRSRLAAGKSIKLTSNSLSYSVLIGDYRKYFWFGKRYTLACRLIGAGSFGEDAFQFGIGGSQTLRGHEEYECIGSYAGLFNLELRYPFVEVLSLAFPLPIELRGVRGALFFDAGGATDDLKTFKVSAGDAGWFRLQDLKAGVGVGVRMNVSFLVLRLDVAKPTDLSSLSGKTRVHFSLGSDF